MTSEVGHLTGFPSLLAKIYYFLIAIYKQCYKHVYILNCHIFPYYNVFISGNRLKHTS